MHNVEALLDGSMLFMWSECCMWFESVKCFEVLENGEKNNGIILTTLTTDFFPFH